MMHLEIGSRRMPIAAGETVIGSAPDCTVVLEGEGVQAYHAIVTRMPDGGIAIRSADPDADLRINGIRHGADPTPVLHGDKIQLGPHEILVVDDRRGGHTQLFDSGAFADLVPSRQPAKPPAAGTGGRVVCLTDGREYTIGVSPLVFGRDAASDVVVSGSEVSRRHAEIQVTNDGYVLMDYSVNGVLVNGQRMGRRHLLARADVIRIGNDEFRFYADAAPAPSIIPARPRSTPISGSDQPPTGAGQRLSDTMHGVPISELRQQPITPASPQQPITPASPQPAPLASLLVRTGAMKGSRLPVRVPVVNIGRADFNDIVLTEPSVSTSHAKLQRRDDIWVLSDLGSTNGTFVEGEPVTGETALTPGTTLRFGDVAVLFEPLDDVGPASRPAGTQVMEGIAANGQRVEDPWAESQRPVTRERHRPLRAATPKPSGPPVWLLAALVLIGAVVAFFILTSR
jgi:pSer/pThr/pTyr-binding forkhead associated (FHA) protein